MANIPAQAEAETLIQENYNAADPVQVNTARKKGARLERERLEVIEALLQNEKTRAWLWDLIAGIAPHSNPVVPGDTHATYFNLGQQNVGKQLLMDAIQFPELYMKMASESKTRR